MSEFNPIEGIGGVWTRKCEIHADNRGYFFEELRESILPIETPNFVQDSISYSKRHVLRGMHLQKNQWQLVTLLSGEIIDVVLNLDENSSEYLKSASISLSWDATNQILIRPGIAHGYAVISDNGIIHYKSSIYYEDTPQIGVHWQSKEIMNYWPDFSWTISQRDSDFQST